MVFLTAFLPRPYSAILAHERLAVVGLSSGAQPILSADGASCLSVNGEIYNHRELEKELDENVQFSTDSDCEVGKLLVCCCCCYYYWCYCYCCCSYCYCCC